MHSHLGRVKERRMMGNRADRKLLAVKGGGHGAGGDGGGGHCPHDTRQRKENTKHLKCINFSASDRTTRHFSGWCQKR